MSNWFEGWFDSKYYHTLYKNRDQKEAQFFIDKLTDFLQIKEDQKILDLACGKGRHSIYLNQKGFSVVGADLSEQSILHAQQYENEKLKFVVHDMREVLQEKTFHFVLNLFTSFGYFEKEEEQYKTIHSVEQMLLPNGILVIDFMNAHKVVKNLVASETKEVDGITFQLKRSIQNGFIIKDISFTDKGKQYNFQERVKVINQSHFESYVKDWDIVNIFGDYQLSQFDIETSDRFILIAKKKN